MIISYEIQWTYMQAQEYSLSGLLYSGFFLLKKVLISRSTFQVLTNKQQKRFALDFVKGHEVD